MNITLRVQCHLTIESAQSSHCVAMLRPRSGFAQWLSKETYRFSHQVRTTEFVDQFGNLCQRFEAPAGLMQINVDATVATDKDLAVAMNLPPTQVNLLPDSVMQFMLPSRYCPVDRIGNMAFDIAGHFIPGSAQVEAVRSWINQNIIYEYGQSDASTDAFDTLSKGRGVCRDFAHIGMTLCRSLLIPSRMVVGYLHKLDPMDLHAWFEAYIDGRWYTIDPTQAVPSGGRVVLGYGRDAADVAFLTSYGQVHTTEMITTVEEVEPD